MRDNGWRFMGAKAVLRVSPMRRATSFEPLRSLNPTFAIGRGMRDAFLAAVARLREFRRAYRVAYEQWKAGLRTVEFPPGTWALVQYHGAQLVPT